MRTSQATVILDQSMVMVADDQYRDFALSLGFEEGCRDASELVDKKISQACFLPTPPPAGAFVDLTDDEISWELGSRLRSAVYQLQSIVEAMTAEGGSIAVLIPAEAALGGPESALCGAFCGGMLSVARTLALELKRSGISVNTVLYGDLSADEQTAIAALLDVYRNCSVLTGQETYIADGINLGRSKP